MALKKAVGTRKKTPVRAKAVVPATSPSAAAPAVRKNAWTLPIAAMALVVASSGLWVAAREWSSATEAATPGSPHATIAPEAASGRGKIAVAESDAPKPTETARPAETVRPAETATAVSITGCLQRGDNGFVLKNVDGAAAPKARSWKSAFIRKGNAPVDLREASTAANLGSHVGQRVSVSGPLVNREMRVVSLRRLAAACE